MRPARTSPVEIGIIGSINRDTIYLADERRIDSWGGILYNTHFLHENSKAIIRPAVNIGRDAKKDIFDILGRYKRVDTSAISVVEASNNHCFLHYHDQVHKCEILKGGVPRLTCSRLRSLLSGELVLVNFISGRDVHLAALERFRREYEGVIYMDVHSLTLGSRKVAGGLKRFLRRPRYLSRYLACADIVQINREEFEVLSGMPLSQANAKAWFASELGHTRALLITLGAEGVFVICKTSKLLARPIAAEPVARVYDTTGCGDAFAAGFVAEYATSHKIMPAARTGNRLAAARCRRRGRMF